MLSDINEAGEREVHSFFDEKANSHLYTSIIHIWHFICFIYFFLTTGLLACPDWVESFIIPVAFLGSGIYLGRQHL